MRLKKKIAVLVGLGVANAALLALAQVWFNAILVNDGEITVYVNSLGEGIVETLLFAAGWLVCVVSIGLILVEPTETSSA